MPYKDRARQRAYQNRWVQQRRTEWLKANGPCSQCGSEKNLRIVTRDPSNAVSHRVWSWRKAKRDKVLGLCVILCLDCMRKHHCPDGPRKRRRPRKSRKQRLKEQVDKAIPRARGLAVKWQREFIPIDFPLLCSELGREPVGLVLSEAAKGEQYMAEFLQAVPTGPSVVKLAVRVLVDQGALRQKNGKAYYLQRRGKQLEAAALVASVAVGSLWQSSVDDGEDELPTVEYTEETENETTPNSDIVTRVLYRMFGYDD